MRYLISGGSALSEKVQKDLHGLGFTVLEGYGLTESSPVLTVARPGNKLLRGSVGKPLPGVEVKIGLKPDSKSVQKATEAGFEVLSAAEVQAVVDGFTAANSAATTDRIGLGISNAQTTLQDMKDLANLDGVSNLFTLQGKSVEAAASA